MARVAATRHSRKGESKSGDSLVATQMRFDKQGLDKIDRAAGLLGSTRSEFVRRSAVAEAEKVILDQVYFGVDRKTFDFFTDLVSRPPGGEGYERLMAVKPRWKEDEGS
jgi:uncharacterized protein (DUF1778 family)